MYNKDFYPTPDSIAKTMLSKIKNKREIKSILEPSAGKGHLIDMIYEDDNFSHNVDVFAIEIEPELRRFLKAKNLEQEDKRFPRICNVIDNDFLKHNGIESYDLIVGNFPFSNDIDHLLKAIDILFSGQIICLINAETIKNPYTHKRKHLAQILDDLGAEIEFIQNGFIDAERETGVEVAMIYINKETYLQDTFSNLKEEDEEIKFEENRDIERANSLETLVHRYELERDRVRSFILDYYQKSNLVKEYISLNVCGLNDDSGDLTQTVKYQFNQFSKTIKKKYWNKALELDVVSSRLTSQKRKEFRKYISENDKVEFSIENVQQLLIDLTADLPEMMSDSIVNLFEIFTKHSLRDNRWGAEFKKNIHYFSGWKTNNAYKVQKKVIIPFYQDLRWNDELQVNYDQVELLNDMDRVLKYFNFNEWKKDMSTYCKDALKEGQNKKIETDYFFVSIYKKGTMHLEFKDMEVLRLFNIEAAKKLNFLPEDYAQKEYDDLSEKEKNIVNQFESKSTYKANAKGSVKLFSPDQLLIEAIGA